MPIRIPSNWRWITGVETLAWGAVPARGNKEIHETGKILGPFIHVKDFAGGVEPKFLAYIRDEKYNDAVAKIILDHIEANDNNSPIVKKIKNLSSGSHSLQRVRLAILEAIRKKRLHKLQLFDAIQEELECGKVIIEALQELPPAQQLTKYLIKQDYKDRTGFFSNRVTIAKRRALLSGTLQDAIKKAGSYAGFLAKFVENVGAWAYKKGRLKKKKEENKNALLECMAAKIANVSGMETHEQGMVFGTYRDGHPKLMTLTAWKDGFSDFEGKLAGGSKLHGNYFVEMDAERDVFGNKQPKKDKDGYFISDNSLTDLGENLPLILRQGDYDVLGGKGGNKGFFNKKLFGIDFGHVYREKNPIVATLQDDFSFDFTKQKNPFKNITVFYDNPLSEKMKGIHYLIKQRTGQNPSDEIMEAYGPEFRKKINRIQKDNDLAVFDTYIAKMKALAEHGNKENPPDGGASYLELAEKIKKSKEIAMETDASMLKIFEARKNLLPEELNFIDAIEKLLSKTDNLSPGSTVPPIGKVKLNHLRVIAPRVVCQLAPDKINGLNQLTISAKNPNDAKEKIEKLKKFSNEAVRGDVKFDYRSGKITISCSNQQLTKMIEKFTENAVAIHKKQRTLNVERSERMDVEPLSKISDDSPKSSKPKSNRQSLLFEYSGEREKARGQNADSLDTNKTQKPLNIAEPQKKVVEKVVKDLVKTIQGNRASEFVQYRDTKVTYQEQSIVSCNFSGGKVIEAASHFYRRLNKKIAESEPLQSENITIEPPTYTLQLSGNATDEKILELLEKAEISDPKIVITHIKIDKQEPESIDAFKKRTQKQKKPEP